MIFRRLSKWLLTEQGKTFSFFASGTAITGVMVAHFLPHTLLLDQYKDLISLYKKGMSVPLSKKLQDRFQRTLDLLEIESENQKLYQPFHVYGFDMMSAGSTRSKFGAIIGLPINFEYNSIDTSHDKPAITVDSKPLDWNTEYGKQLLKSLIIPENAQIYAMAHEIKMRQTLKPILDLVYGFTSACFVYGVTTYLNKKGNLYSKPLYLRLIMYGLVTTFSVTTYFMFKDLTTVFLEKRIDDELKKKDIVFIEGGKEFYSQLIERNKTLREIMGVHGEKLYTALGNENNYLRTKHIPLVQRKAFFEEDAPERTLKS